MRKDRLMRLIQGVLIVLLLLPGSALWAAGEKEQPLAKGEQIKLLFMGWEASPLETQSVKNGLAAFMKAKPQFVVDYIPGPSAQHHTKLLTMMAGGSAPDTFFLDPGFVIDFVKRDVLLDLTDYFRKFYKLDDFIPSSQEKMLVNDKIYGVCSCIVAPVIFYNKDLFDKAGVEYPPVELDKAWTWDKMVEVAKKLTVKEGDKTVQYGIYGMELEDSTVQIVLSSGAEWFNKDKNALIVDSPEGRDALQKIKELRTKHGVSPSASFLENVGMNASQMLQSGKVAMLFVGSFSLQELAKMKFKVGVGLPPKLKSVTLAGSAYLASVWKNTKYPAETMELVTYLSSIDYQLPMITSGLWMSNRTAMYTPDGIKKWLNPEVHPAGFEKMAPLFQNARLRPTRKLNNNGEVRDIIRVELENFFKNDEALDVVMPRMTAKVNVAIKK